MQHRSLNLDKLRAAVLVDYGDVAVTTFQRTNHEIEARGMLDGNLSAASRRLHDVARRIWRC
jgi:hypothetical protein